VETGAQSLSGDWVGEVSAGGDRGCFREWCLGGRGCLGRRWCLLVARTQGGTVTSGGNWVGGCLLVWRQGHSTFKVAD
jgi:hypothetical protein